MDVEWKQAAIALLAWYRRFGRKLPWRLTTDPYAILVSEFMLQQTRVETVIPYYHRFLRRFPTLGALAAAAEEDVLAAWEGLGYYRRARHLHATAQALVQHWQGRLPDDPAVLRGFPGVGAYTAAALASIVHGRRAAALDGNIVRVMARVTAEDDDVARAPVRRSLAQAVEALQAHGHPGDINQALMELGATICLPRAPDCGNCPLRATCAAHRGGHPERFPARGAPARKVTEQRAAALLVVPGRGVVLRRRPDGGLLAGLWELPSVPGHGPEAAADLTRLLAAAGFDANPRKVLARKRWAFSHRLWDMELWRFEPVLPRARAATAATAAAAETAGDQEPGRESGQACPDALEVVPLDEAPARPVPALMRRWLDEFGSSSLNLTEL
ncbi:MAG TPA: A/G-specific adenine glycosylase [Bacillota bacterium]